MALDMITSVWTLSLPPWGFQNTKSKFNQVQVRTFIKVYLKAANQAYFSIFTTSAESWPTALFQVIGSLDKKAGEIFAGFL